MIENQKETAYFYNGNICISCDRILAV